jgi:hypothetical protein
MSATRFGATSTPTSLKKEVPDDGVEVAPKHVELINIT